MGFVRINDDNARELADSYVNGNTSYVRKKLKNATKITVLHFAGILMENGRDGIYETERLLR